MTLQDGADRAKGEIGQRLDSPAGIVTLSQLAERWFRGITSMTLPGMAAVAGDPGLIGRIRGAFGARLTDSASREALAGAPCPWSPPCSFEPLWRKQGRMDKGYDHASPWVLQLDPHGGDLTVRLVLFGFANDWVSSALDALTGALLHDVDWKGRTGHFAPRPEIVRRHLAVEEAIVPPAAGQSLQITLLTPLSLSGTDPRERPRSLIMGLVKRLDALARWHDCALDPALDRDVVADWLSGVSLDWQDCDVVDWQRGSDRQDRWIPMRGLVGTLEIQAERAEIPPELMLALMLGETCAWGADVAFGCGRYAMRKMP